MNLSFQSVTIVVVRSYICMYWIKGIVWFRVTRYGQPNIPADLPMNVPLTVSRTHNFLSYKKYGHVVSTGYFLLSWSKSTPPRNQNQGFLFDRLRGESYVIRTFIVSIRIYIYTNMKSIPWCFINSVFWTIFWWIGWLLIKSYAACKTDDKLFGNNISISESVLTQKL